MDVDFHSHLDFVANGVLYLDFYGATDRDLYLYADRNPHSDLDEYRDLDPYGHRHEYFVEYAHTNLDANANACLDGYPNKHRYGD